MKIFKRIIERYRQQRDRRLLGEAVDKALSAHQKDGRRYYVFSLAGELKVLSTADLKTLRRSRMLKKGVTLEDLRRRAIYKTPLK